MGGATHLQRPFLELEVHAYRKWAGLLTSNADHHFNSQSMATTWVNLLRKNGVDTPSRSSAARQTSRAGLGRGVTVSEKTPQARVGAKKSTTRSKESSSVQVLRSQIANLLREKRQLADKV